MNLTIEQILLNITDPSKWVNPYELIEIIQSNPSLRGMTYGYVSEQEFVKYLGRDGAGITKHYKDDDHKKTKSDRTIFHNGRMLTIQLKSFQTNTIRSTGEGTFRANIQNDASDRRKVKLPDGSEVETTCYVVGEYDILAVSLQPFTGEWTYAFKKNKDLSKSTHTKYTEVQRSYLLATTENFIYPIAAGSHWTTNLFDLLNDPDLGSIHIIQDTPEVEIKAVTPPGSEQEVVIEEKQNTRG